MPGQVFQSGKSRLFPDPENPEWQEPLPDMARCLDTILPQENLVRVLIAVLKQRERTIGVLLVDGSYDDAFDLTVQASEEFGWYCRNTGYNPFTAEGKKSAAYEIWEWRRSAKLDFDLSELNLFVSVGDGNIISGIHKGFKDLVALGWLDKSPRIFGVQSYGSAAIANAFLAGGEQIVAVSADTLADSISVDLPRDGVRAVRAARRPLDADLG